MVSWRFADGSRFISPSEPNLPDETDNHVLELALAGGATTIATQNVRDFQRGELRFPHLKILHPKDWLEELYHDHNDR